MSSAPRSGSSPEGPGLRRGLSPADPVLSRPRDGVPVRRPQAPPWRPSGERRPAAQARPPGDEARRVPPQRGGEGNAARSSRSHSAGRGGARAGRSRSAGSSRGRQAARRSFSAPIKHRSVVRSPRWMKSRQYFQREKRLAARDAACLASAGMHRSHQRSAARTGGAELVSTARWQSAQVRDPASPLRCRAHYSKPGPCRTSTEQTEPRGCQTHFCKAEAHINLKVSYRASGYHITQIHHSIIGAPRSHTSAKHYVPLTA